MRKSNAFQLQAKDARRSADAYREQARAMESVGRAVPALRRVVSYVTTDWYPCEDDKRDVKLTAESGKERELLGVLSAAFGFGEKSKRTDYAGNEVMDVVFSAASVPFVRNVILTGFESRACSKIRVKRVVPAKEEEKTVWECGDSEARLASLREEGWEVVQEVAQE